MIYQVFKKLGITMRWGRCVCEAPKIEILNDMINERGCPWCNLEIVEAVMLMLASTVIKLLGNILAIYIGCKAVIPVVFTGDVYFLVDLVMGINSSSINMVKDDSGSDEKYRLQVVLCVGALGASSVERLCDVPADNSAYIVDGSFIQCVGVEFVRRDVRAPAIKKVNSDSGRQFKVKVRYKTGLLNLFSDCLSRLIC